MKQYIKEITEQEYIKDRENPLIVPCIHDYIPNNVVLPSGTHILGLFSKPTQFESWAVVKKNNRYYKMNFSCKGDVQ